MVARHENAREGLYSNGIDNSIPKIVKNVVAAFSTSFSLDVSHTVSKADSWQSQSGSSIPRASYAMLSLLGLVQRTKIVHLGHKCNFQHAMSLVQCKETHEVHA